MPRPALPGVNSQGRRPGRQFSVRGMAGIDTGCECVLILSLLGLLLVRAN